MSEEKAYQATDPGLLRKRIMDCRIAKTEHEHWAARRIKALEDTLALVAKDMPYFECQHLHHNKEDYHAVSEPCPVQERLLFSMSEVQRLMKNHN